ncbi:hypothetical protein [Chachezhania sediminis]|uniref:hypothetical protein n=1 Tax=Chachezhania sediminis TaxID=2599291 RepID=UPI00131E3C09|nr:hypothetical protein [Chachezhania sediminis]
MIVSLAAPSAPIVMAFSGRPDPVRFPRGLNSVSSTASLREDGPTFAAGMARKNDV